jgi:hypothetical protein
MNLEAQSGVPSWRRVARIVLPRSARRRLGQWYGDLGIERVPDRIYLTGEILPAVAARGGKVLFVGCMRYTRHYPSLLEQHGAECWTIDVNPAVARWGAPDRHVTGAIEKATDHWARSSFDTVVLSGVFGYGLNTDHEQEAALRVSRLLLKDDGRFVLGWNTDRCADPANLSTLQQHFRPASLNGLPLRKTFPNSTHVFQFFQPHGRLEGGSEGSGFSETSAS